MRSYIEKFNNQIDILRKFDKIESFKTKYQEVDIIRHSTDKNYECLFIDKEIQTSIQDEFFYHESLIHPSMFAHENPKDVLLLGGGDGMALREILKHSVDSVTIIDLDEEFVTWCMENRYSWHNNSFNDKRVKIIYGDALKEIKKFYKNFDIIFIDLVTLLDKDLFGDNISYSTIPLYSESFYKSCYSALKNSNGILTTQSHGLTKADNSYLRHNFINKELCKVFSITKSYSVYIESFLYSNSFISCSDITDISKLNSRRINDIINMENDLKIYEFKFHENLFYLNKLQRSLLC